MTPSKYNFEVKEFNVTPATKVNAETNRFGMHDKLQESEIKFKNKVCQDFTINDSNKK